jgi:hypothetical protein
MNNDPQPYDPEAHRAWLDSLSPDELLTVYVPPGHMLTLIGTALMKRAVQSPGIKPGEKLRLLEMVNGWTDLWFTPEMLALVDPMSDTEFQIYREAKSLDPEDDKRCQASFDVLSSPRVFWHFFTLNRGIANAIKWRESTVPLPVRH